MKFVIGCSIQYFPTVEQCQLSGGEIYTVKTFLMVENDYLWRCYLSDPIVYCDNLVKIYKVADLEVVALQGLDLEVMPGEMLALMGASGSGKSTLLNLLSGLDTPSAGRCVVNSFDITQLSAAQRLSYRRRSIGHIWQQSGRNLISHYTLAENLDIPQMTCGIAKKERQRRTTELLEAVGLGGREKAYPFQLSGGEQQRAGVAVAIVHRPPVLLADEPTGELDTTTAAQIMQLLRQIQSVFHLTIILVTHDAGIAANADRVVALRDGRTSTETRRHASTNGKSLTGFSTDTHRELVVVDRVGRLQLPRDVIEGLKIRGHVQVLRTEDHVELWPYHSEQNDSEKIEIPVQRKN
jgi:ABC-type lipoprotein export system ATPase subunit